MRPTVLLGALAAALLAAPAPSASADHDLARCWLRAQQDSLTGDSFAGALAGLAAGDPRETVRIQCFVTVNGVVATATPVAEGTGAAVTAGDATFRAGDDDVVRLCTRGYTDTHGWRQSCHDGWEPALLSDLPYGAIGVLNAVLAAYADPLACPALKSLTGTYGAVDVTADGDVLVVGRLLWDCPPYEVAP